MPKFFEDKSDFHPENTELTLRGLIRGLREAAQGMRDIQHEYAQAGSRLNSVAAELGQQMQGVSTSIDGIKSLLRQGFRLPDNDD